jgi:hypothetical protein
MADVIRSLLAVFGACAIAAAAFADAARAATDAPGVEASLAAQIELLDLLRGRQFAELTRRVEAEQAAFEADLQREPVTNQMWNTFGITDPALGPALDAWTAAVASYGPQVARGLYLRERAWAARGGKWASETSASQFAEMQE